MGKKCVRTDGFIGINSEQKKADSSKSNQPFEGTVYKIISFLRMKRMHEMIYFQPAYFFNKELIHEAIFKASPFGTCGIGAIGVA